MQFAPIWERSERALFLRPEGMRRVLFRIDPRGSFDALHLACDVGTTFGVRYKRGGVLLAQRATVVAKTLTSLELRLDKGVEEEGFEGWTKDTTATMRFRKDKIVVEVREPPSRRILECVAVG